MCIPREVCFERVVKLAALLAAANLYSGDVCLAQSNAVIVTPAQQSIHIFNPASGQASRNSLTGQAVSVTTNDASPVTSGIGTGVITYTCDPNVNSLGPSSTCAMLNGTIAGIYSGKFSNATASIYIKYGATGLGSSSQYLNFVTYTQYRNALIANSSGSAADLAAIASLPATEPGDFSSGKIEVSSALGTALGFTGVAGADSSGGPCTTPGTAGCYNGVITLAFPVSLAVGGQGYFYRSGVQTSNQYDFFTVVEHETNELLGTISCTGTSGGTLSRVCGNATASAADLFRYSGSASRVVLDVTPGAYFSNDGGVTTAEVYNTLANGQDYADWVTSCKHVQDATGCLGSSFDITTNGGVEVTVLDAIGYNLIPSATITAAFNPNSIVSGGTSLLTLALSNSGTSGMTGGSFTDTLINMGAVGGPVGGSCIGTSPATLGTGATALSFAGITMPANSSCTVSFSVTSNIVGVNNNQTSGVTTSQTAAGPASNIAMLTVIALAPPTISKAFNPASVVYGGVSAVTLTLSNSNASNLIGGAFTDNLVNMIASGGPVGGSCAAAPNSLAAGVTALSFTGVAIPANGSCTVTFNVTGSTVGVNNNQTSGVSTTQAATGPPSNIAVLTVSVGDPFQISYASNLSVGDSFVDISNVGTAGAGLQSGTTAATTGAICANVYAFTPDEQMVACCSCPVTPNGLVSLSVVGDLAGNTLTPAIPTALVIKLLATLPIAGSCTNSAAAVTIAALAPGMRSFGTTIHATPAAGTYGVTERPFSIATLSAGELNRIGTLCNFILANGSGFGICRSCRLGGLGASRQ